MPELTPHFTSPVDVTGITRPLDDALTPLSEQNRRMRGSSAEYRWPPPWQLGVFAILPLGWLATAMTSVTVGRDWSVRDFLTFRAAAEHLLRGTSPYPPPDPSVLAGGHGFVYPPIAGYVFAPFVALSEHVATIAYLALSVAALGAALRLLGVRDWRVYGVVALWQPLLMWLAVGALEPWLALGIALAWRLRDRAVTVSAAVAVMVALKLFLWPLIIWLAATRRFRSTLTASALSCLLVLVPFAALPRADLSGYPRLLRTLDDVYGRSSYSSAALARSLGLPAPRVWLIALAVGLVVLIVRSAIGAGGDHRSLAVAAIACLLLSPIVWAHYFLLLIIPLALMRRDLSPAWFAPIILWFAGSAALADPIRFALAAFVVSVVVATAFTSPEARGRARRQAPANVAAR